MGGVAYYIDKGFGVSKEYEGVLMEAMNDKLDALAEGFDTFKDVPSRLDRIESDVSELKSDVKVVKGVLHIHSADIAEIKSDIKVIKSDLHTHSADITELKAKIA
jgi:peptidoglycan hydrolase CwlO-like protein